MHEVNNFVIAPNTSSRIHDMENNFKCSTATSLKPPLTNPFVSNTFANMNRPSYDQSYNSFWNENSATLQTPAHSYGFPYYIRNARSATTNSTSVNNEFGKNISHKNTASKANNTPTYQPNIGQIKHHVNWMTTDTSNQSKLNNPIQTDSIGSFVTGYQLPSQSDDILGVASSRLLDSSSFLSEPALPNLNGDLALSTISGSCIHSTSTSARQSNIQDDPSKLDKNTATDNNVYQRVNNFSAESLFSNIVSNNTSPDTKRRKHSNEYFSSAQDTNSDAGFVSTTSFFQPTFENLNCAGINGTSSTTNGLNYTHYSHHQNSKNCNNRPNPGDTANSSYKNIHNFSPKNQLPFSVPVFRDSCKPDLSLANQNYKTELNGEESGTQHKFFELAYANSDDINKSSKNMARVEASTNAFANFDSNYLDRSNYGINAQLQTDSRTMYPNTSTKSKNQIPYYNHLSSSVPVNINSEPTNSISNTITNFNLSTICPEIDRDFLIK